jgi:hypothetical protein
MGVRVLLVLTTLQILPYEAIARTPEFCDTHHVSKGVEDPQRYASRANGTYCDGAVIEPNAGVLTIVSVTSGTSIPIANVPAALKFSRASIPNDTRNQDLVLRGLSLDPAVTYQLDARIHASIDVFTVGTESGMRRLRLSSEDVGWVAYIPNYKGRRLVVPVVRGGPTESEIVILVRPALNSQGVRFEVLKDGAVMQTGSGSATGSDRSIFQLNISRGDPSLVEIKVWSVSTANDIESDQFFLARG